MSDIAELTRRTPRFELGQVVATPGALVALAFNGVTALSLIRRHIQGDWGDLSEEDRIANERALTDGSRLLSSYTLEDGQKIWVITEANRSVSTLLCPDEY